MRSADSNHASPGVISGLPEQADRHKKTPAFSQGHQGLPVTFPTVMLWRKRPSNTPTLRSLSTTFSQQKKRLRRRFIIYAPICFAVANNKLLERHRGIEPQSASK